MNKELEIRAARALKFRRYRAEEGFWRVPPKFQKALGKMVIYPLRFTTSYDWAYLGLQDQDEDFLYKVGRKIMDRMLVHEWRYVLSASAEEMTLAWVEVKEGI